MGRRWEIDSLLTDSVAVKHVLVGVACSIRWSLFAFGAREDKALLIMESHRIESSQKDGL